MPEPILLAVVEVDKHDRVACQAPNCNRPVYKQIHIVELDGALRVLGCECYERLVGHGMKKGSTPRYGASEGRRLTSEERQLLIENAARLIDRFEAERRAAAAAPEVRHQWIAEVTKSPVATPNPRSPVSSVDDRRSLEVEAKRILRDTYGVDPDLSGWRGMVEMTITDLLRKRA